MAAAHLLQDGDALLGHVDRVERLVFEDGVEDLLLVVALERALTEEHLVDEDAKGPPVDRATVALLEEDLGRHELGRAAEGGRRRAVVHAFLAETVVGHLDVAVEREEDVVELEIAVDDAAPMQELERQQDLGRVEARPTRGELLALDVQHQVAAAGSISVVGARRRAAPDILHAQVDARLGLEARVESEQERVILARGSEEDPLLRLSAAGIRRCAIRRHRTCRPHRSR